MSSVAKTSPAVQSKHIVFWTGWIFFTLVLAALLTSSGEISWKHAFLLAAILSGIAQVSAQSSFVSCRIAPLTRTPLWRLFATHIAAAVLLTFFWVKIGSIVAVEFDAHESWRGVAKLYQDKTSLLHAAGVFFYLLAITVALAAGLIHAELLMRLYLIAVAGLFLNSLRTLAAHRYRSTGDALTRPQQLLDSLNYPRRSWLTPLWAPVGLRFHAMHHLFPSIPYHNLAAAHNRVTGMLPPGSPYHRATGYGLVASLAELWRNAR